eukprot:jgi/Ulvmu1/10166/UM006_0121.1
MVGARSDSAIALAVAAGGLREAVQRELTFLRQVHSHADLLYDPEVIKLACCRYEYVWLPLLKAGKPTVPPVDIAFVWHCHILSQARYAAACGAAVGAAPDFIYPATTPPPEEATPRLRVKLTSRAAAITSMRQSILACLPKQNGAAADGDGRGPPLPPLKHTEELIAAVAQHKDFFYQVALPHYRDPEFVQGAVTRYETFVSLQQGRLHEALQAPCDIELVRRAHICMTAQQRELLRPHLRTVLVPSASSGALGRSGSNGSIGRTASNGSIIRSASNGKKTNGHSTAPAVEYAELDSSTRGAFAAAGEELYRAGGMFRGIPTRQSAKLREEALPWAPASGIKVRLKRCDWHAEGPAHSAAAAPAAITGWKLAKSSLLGSAPGSFRAARTPIVLRNREPVALQLTMQVAETAPGGGVKTHTASSKTKVNPVTLLQGGTQAVMVRLPVKLKHAATRTWLVTATLQIGSAYDVITCGFPVGTPSVAVWPHIRSVAASKAEVTAPLLLLPRSAVVDTGPDVAEVLTYTVNGPDSADSLRGPPMQVKVVSSTKHLAAVVEVYATAAVPDASIATDSPAGITPTASRTPAATAHSINLDQLPAPASLRNASLKAISLDASVGERAFLIRGGDEDWAVLIGRWKGQKPADPVAQTSSKPGFLAWRLILLEDPRIGPDPASQGYSAVVRMTSYAKRSREKVFCGHSGWAWLNCSASTGQFRLEFDENSSGPETAREAGRLSALLTAVSCAAGLVRVFCMPCTRSVAHPENPLQTLHDVTADSRGFVSTWQSAANCRPFAAFSFLPTNGYVSKRLFVERSCMGTMEHKITLPWYGTANEKACAAVSATFWGGLLADAQQLEDMYAAWAYLPPSRKSSAGMSVHTFNGGDAAACNGGCSGTTAGASLAAAVSPAGASPTGSQPSMQRGGSTYMSSGSLI